MSKSEYKRQNVQRGRPMEEDYANTVGAAYSKIINRNFEELFFMAGDDMSDVIKVDDFRLTEFHDGSVCLQCGDGMNRDLVFASGAMTGDPDLEKQREILEFIIRKINAKA